MMSHTVTVSNKDALTLGTLIYIQEKQYRIHKLLSEVSRVTYIPSTVQNNKDWPKLTLRIWWTLSKPQINDFVGVYNTTRTHQERPIKQFSRVSEEKKNEVYDHRKRATKKSSNVFFGKCSSRSGWIISLSAQQYIRFEEAILIERYSCFFQFLVMYYLLWGIHVRSAIYHWQRQ